MADTYGFGGSEPTRNVDSPSQGGVNTHSGNDTDNSQGQATKLEGGDWSGNIRGPGPDDAMGVTCTFDESIVKDMGGTTSIGAGVVSTLGAWPTTNHGALGDTHPANPSSVTSVTGAVPGSASSCGYNGD